MRKNSLRSRAGWILGSLLALATLTACSSGSSDPTHQVNLELVPTDLDRCRPELLQTASRACADRAPPTVIWASDEQASVPITVGEGQSYQVRLLSNGAGNAHGTVRFVPTVSGTYGLYLGTTYMPLNVSAESSDAVLPTCARSITDAYSTELTGKTCSDLKVAYAVPLNAGQGYRISLGPISPQSSVRLRLEAPVDPGLTAADYGATPPLCRDVSNEGCALAETESIPVSSPGPITSGHVYGVALRPVGGENRAFVGFVAEYTDDFDVYLGSPSVPFAISDAGARLTPACGGGLSQSGQQLGCAALRVQHQVHLSAGKRYQFELGPAPNDWVRVFVTPHNPDSDQDGLSDRYDGCPSDAEKTSPGACGCSVPEGSCGVIYPKISAAGGTVCAILGSGALKCWGGNSLGNLGLGDTLSRGGTPATIGANLPAVDLGNGRRATAISVGFTGTCALLDDRTGKCWGDTFGYGTLTTLGDGPGEMGEHLPPLFGAGVQIDRISNGFEHTCVVRSGDLYCWGLNGAGQLGRYTSQNPSPLVPSIPRVELGTGQTVVSAALGNTHTCAVLESGQVKCWGSNYHGELGLGDTRFRGFDPADMGDALPPLNLGKSAKAAVAGYNYGCALLVDGVVKCWGLNDAGILGQGDKKNRGDNPGEVLRKVDLGAGRTVLALAGGFRHACALLDNHQLKCWGNNQPGALGLGDTNHRGDQPGEMADALPAVDLGAGLRAVSVAAGYGSSCAVMSDASIKCWGAGGAGKGARGDTLTHGDGPGEMGDALSRAVLQ